MNPKLEDDNESIVLDAGEDSDDDRQHRPVSTVRNETASDTSVFLVRIEQLLKESVVEQVAVMSTQLSAVLEQVSTVAAKLNDVGEQISHPPAATMPVAALPPETLITRNEAETSAPQRRLERLFCGPELAQQDNLTTERERLIEDLLAGRAEAAGLAARLLLVQTASAEEVPNLLKEIGEAFYRWCPKTEVVADAWEESLVAFLSKRISAVGLRNSLELVRPGDRYDTSRHITSDRGVEVRTVAGWVVLRENGKALTKASVALR